MTSKNYKGLIVWQRSMELVLEIYKITRSFPPEELYSLTAQMKRAAVSIPSNIAEGQQRNSKKDFVKFLIIARGSNAELETQTEISLRLGYLDNGSALYVTQKCTEIGKMLNSLISKLSC